MPTLLIDADGCSVVNLTVRLFHSRGTPVLILCDTAHRIEREGAQTLVFDKGADSVDRPGRRPAARRTGRQSAGHRQHGAVPLLG